MIVARKVLLECVTFDILAHDCLGKPKSRSQHFEKFHPLPHVPQLDAYTNYARLVCYKNQREEILFQDFTSTLSWSSSMTPEGLSVFSEPGCGWSLHLPKENPFRPFARDSCPHCCQDCRELPFYTNFTWLIFRFHMSAQRLKVTTVASRGNFEINSHDEPSLWLRTAHYLNEEQIVHASKATHANKHPRS